MGYFDKFNSGKGIPFMEGRELAKINTILGEELHPLDYGYIKGDEGDYAVIHFKEHEDVFYFGNQILTDALKQIDSDGQKEALLSGNVRMIFNVRTSNKGRDYTAVEFIED